MKKIFSRLLKISFFVAAFLFVIFTVLTNIGGNSSVLHQSVEQYVSEATGYVTQITKLNTMQFFPDIIIDVEGVHLKDAEQKTVLTADKFKISFSFFDVLFTQGRFRDFQIQNMSLAPGLVVPSGLKIDKLVLEDKKDKGRLSLQGRIGAENFSLLANIDIKGSPARRTFFFGDQWNFESMISDLALRGTVQNNPGADLKIEPFSFLYNKQPVLSGVLEVKRGGDHFDLKGRLQTLPKSSVILPDMVLNIAPFSLKGKIIAEKLYPEDFMPDAPVIVSLQRLIDIFDGEGVQKQKLLHPVQLDLQADQIILGAANIGNFSGALKTTQNEIEFNALSGKILGGDLGGFTHFSYSQAAQKLKTDIKIAGLKVPAGSAVPKPLSGDLKLTLDTEVPQDQKLSDYLKGRLILVGGSGEIKAKNIEKFAPDILKEFFPNLKLEDGLAFKCSIFDFDIEGHKAQSRSFFIDGQSFSFNGHGHFNLQDQSVNFLIEPISKSRSKALSIAGIFPELEVKAGASQISSSGLAKGAKRPNFSSFSLEGLELPVDHPCKSHVIESEILPPPVYNQKAP